MEIFLFVSVSGFYDNHLTYQLTVHFKIWKEWYEGDLVEVELIFASALYQMFLLLPQQQS
jgi:hypothetical protein